MGPSAEACGFFQVGAGGFEVAGLVGGYAEVAEGVGRRQVGVGGLREFQGAFLGGRGGGVVVSDDLVVDAYPEEGLGFALDVADGFVQVGGALEEA
ncbi:hypothetical protein DQ384_25170 [Sphaerisporangium album]|uniref:Uncharacterized protein n=1 Tax=Sphaerisporangium album TaxID=509200 RepID=A0A367FBT5_9ACTN|nr:hypothetical protein DQ384_25170 [Sphaerisporangium album]